MEVEKKRKKEKGKVSRRKEERRKRNSILVQCTIGRTVTARTRRQNEIDVHSDQLSTTHIAPPPTPPPLSLLII